MATPADSPWSTPPTTAQLNATAPPSAPPVFVAPPMEPLPTVEQAVASGQTPPAIALDVPGAQAAHVIAYDLLKYSPKVSLDGIKAKKGMGSKYKVPLTDGGKGTVEIKASIPGYPTIKVNGVAVYRAPKPPFMHVVAFIIATVGGLLGGVGLAGYLLGAVAGVAAGYGAAVWLRQPGSNAVRYSVLIGGGLVSAAVGVALLMWAFSRVV